jgi:type VI secretion system ImpC/EvpB family protein
MKPMGWRFVVLSDLGSAPRVPVRLGPVTEEGWLTPLGIRLDLPRPGSGDPLRLDLSSERAFLPESLPAAEGGAESILHHPSFQKVESGVLGLRLLLEHSAGAVQVEVLSTTAKDAVARFRESVFEPEMKEFREPPLGLILADFDFSHLGTEFSSLTELAGMAQALQAPLVASASPAFFGLKQVNLLPKLQDIPQRLSDGVHSGWQKFQKQEYARWVVLTINRFLQRAVHPSEKVDPAKPEQYLWGRGCWLAAAAVARSAREHGHALDISGARAGGFAGRPTRPYPKLANQTIPLSTEVEIPDQAIQELSRGGFLPISGKTGSDAVVLPIAVNTYRTAPGRLTVSGTLGYQMMAARLAQVCNLLLDELPGPAAEASEFLRKSLGDFLGPLAGKSPETAVTVTPAQIKDASGNARTVADIVVLPEVRIEGMEVRFAFQLPLRQG